MQKIKLRFLGARDEGKRFVHEVDLFQPTEEIQTLLEETWTDLKLKSLRLFPEERLVVTSLDRLSGLSTLRFESRGQRSLWSRLPGADRRLRASCERHANRICYEAMGGAPNPDLHRLSNFADSRGRLMLRARQILRHNISPLPFPGEARMLNQGDSIAYQRLSRSLRARRVLLLACRTGHDELRGILSAPFLPANTGNECEVVVRIYLDAGEPEKVQQIGGESAIALEVLARARVITDAGSFTGYIPIFATAAPLRNKPWSQDYQASHRIEHGRVQLRWNNHNRRILGETLHRPLRGLHRNDALHPTLKEHTLFFWDPHSLDIECFVQSPILSVNRAYLLSRDLGGMAPRLLDFLAQRIGVSLKENQSSLVSYLDLHIIERFFIGLRECQYHPSAVQIGVPTD